MLEILPWSPEFFSFQCLHLWVTLDRNLLPPVVLNQLLTWCILNKPSAAGLMQVCMCTCTQVSESQTNYPPWGQDVNGFSGEIFWGIFTYSECVKMSCDVKAMVLHQINRAGGGGHFLLAWAKSAESPSCLKRSASAHSKLGYKFCSLAKNMYENKRKRWKHKIRCDTFCCNDSAHTCLPDTAVGACWSGICASS